MFKKHKVVMLPTDRVEGNNKLWFNKYEEKDKQFLYSIIKPTGNFKQQHIYILSNEKIKTNIWGKYPVGTWFYSTIRGDVSQLQPKEKGYDPSGWIVISSTDKSLGLPRPSDSFIKKYCELGGIDEVMVEYYLDGYKLKETEWGGWVIDQNSGIPFIKIGADNNIFIKMVKDNWNREEVINLLQQARLFAPSDISAFNKWIEENI